MRNWQGSWKVSSNKTCSGNYIPGNSKLHLRLSFDGAKLHCLKCCCNSSIVVISVHPLSLWSQKICSLLIKFFTNGITSFKSLSLIWKRQFGHWGFSFNHFLTQTEQNTCSHGETNASFKTPWHIQQSNSGSGFSGNRSTSQPIISGESTIESNFFPK